VQNVPVAQETPIVKEEIIEEKREISPRL